MKFGFRKPKSIAPAVVLLNSNPDAHGHPQNCLNCDAALVGSYCHKCGQSAGTHRMSFRHFLMHDVVHGIWHLDKGLPATLKKAFVNPGKEIRAYLAGKRMGWYSILTMILLLYAVLIYLLSVYEPATPRVSTNSKGGDIFGDFISHNAKWLLLGLAFVCSWSSFGIFRRAKLNLSEHTIINSFFLIGILSINIAYILLDSFTPKDSDFLNLVAPIATAGYLVYAYYGTFRGIYTLAGFSWRIVVHGLLSGLIAFALLAIIMLLTIVITGEKTFRYQRKSAGISGSHFPIYNSGIDGFLSTSKTKALGIATRI